MTRFKVDFDGVMDRLEELEQENHRLREREAEFEKQRADYHHVVSELARCERDHDALLHENDALRSKLAGADQRAATYSNELVLALDAGKRIAEERDELQAQILLMRPIVEAVVAIDAAAVQRDKAAEEFGADDDETFQRDLEFGGAVAHAIEQARAFLAAAGQAAESAVTEQAEQPVLRVVVSYACDRDDHEHCNALASGCMCFCHAPQPPESEG